MKQIFFSNIRRVACACNTSIQALLAAGILTGSATQVNSAFRDADGFESAEIDVGWSKRENAGNVLLTSTTRHTGGQSVQFTSTANTGQKNLELNRRLPNPIFGKASVWLYDSGADELSANYVGLHVRNSASGPVASIFTQDYDLGADNGGTYYFSTFDGASSRTSVDRTKAWHHLEISANWDSLTLSVDGSVVHTGPGGVPFDQVQIETHGPTWRPAWTYYFDDFYVEESQPGYIYFSTVATTGPYMSNSKIKRARLDGTGVETLITGPLGGRFGGIAFDPANGHLYSGDRSNLFRANLDGSQRTVLVPNTAVTDIEVDLVRRKVYWSDTEVDQIKRANLDGTGVEIIRTLAYVDLVEGIALSPNAEKLFYTWNTSPAASSLRSINLNGSDDGVFKPLPQSYNPFEVEFDPVTQHIYWNNYGNGTLQRTSADGGGTNEIVFTLTNGFCNGIHVDPVGRAIYYMTGLGAGGCQIYRANIDGTNHQPLLSDPEGVNYVEVVHGLAIVRQPLTQTVAPGSAATFTVGFAAIGAVQFQWYFNGQAIAGQTNSTLTLDGATAATAGRYSVQIRNEYGSRTSDEAVLSVIELKFYAGIKLIGPTNSTFDVQFTTDVAGTNTWTTLRRVTLEGLEELVIDLDSPAFPRRFYRAIPVNSEN